MKSHFAGSILIIFGSLFFISCEKNIPIDPDRSEIIVPDSYTFVRDGQSTVSFSGQTTRIGMATELISAMTDFSKTETGLLEMYMNKTVDGSEANPYANDAYNESSKSVKSKVAASADFFSANTSESATIKADFESWIIAQSIEVSANENEFATPGNAGQIADGSSARYVNAQGLEYDQAVNKGLIGALMLDQILNNYLSPSVLDAGQNIEENNSSTLADGKNYTTMEHKWDEAYGYLFGFSDSPEDPIATLGSDDNFLNKYLGRVDSDDDFAGIGLSIFNAFKLGRAAIVGQDYELRNEQAATIKQELSKVVAIRAVYYLQHAKLALPTNQDDSAYGSAFHDLSEGFGFVYSLRFTHDITSGLSYFSTDEVNAMISDLTEGRGFWDITPEKLDAISKTIAAKFNFTIEQAGD